MSASREPSDPSPASGPGRKGPGPGALTPALIAGALQVAVVVAGWGVLSLVVDRDAIADPAVGPLVGPLAVATSAVVTIVATRRAVGGSPWMPALASAAVSLLTLLTVVALGSAVAHADATWMALAAAEAISRGFVPLAAALSGLSVIAGWGLSRLPATDPRTRSDI